MWHRGEDLVELAQDPRLVDRLDLRLVLGIDERADRRERRRQRDLEAHVRRDHAVALELGEDRERRERRVGEAEVVEDDVLAALPLAKPQLGQRAVGVRAGRADLELRQGAEDRVLPEDPVRPRPGSPSGSRRRRSPSASAVRRKTSSTVPAARCRRDGRPRAQTAPARRLPRPLGRYALPPSRSSPARSSSLITSRSGPAATRATSLSLGPARRRYVGSGSATTRRKG